MSSQHSPSGFRLIKGEKDDIDFRPVSATEESRRLHAVPPARVHPARQLSLPGLARNQSIVSIPLPTIAFEHFEKVVQQYRSKTILDVRLIPSFRRGGFTPDKFFAMLMHHRIDYKHLEKYSEAARSVSRESTARTEILFSYLVGQADITAIMTAAIGKGGVLILGDSLKHQDSERDAIAALLDHLSNRSFDFVTY